MSAEKHLVTTPLPIYCKLRHCSLACLSSLWLKPSSHVPPPPAFPFYSKHPVELALKNVSGVMCDYLPEKWAALVGCVCP